MSPKELILRWVELFNLRDHDGIADLYAADCINHQTPIGVVTGKDNIREMFRSDFAQYEMVCIIENIFQDGNVGMLEWKDPKGLRGCGFFWIENDKIVFQRGYWDKLTFMDQQSADSHQ